MTFAAKHFDPVVGLDTHIVNIPTPGGPVPTPIPHPFVGMVFDAMDYLPGQGATVMVNGLPKGAAGTAVRLTPPHIPLGAGFLVPPENAGEIFTGSMTVLADGAPLSRLGEMAMECQTVAHLRHRVRRSRARRPTDPCCPPAPCYRLPAAARCSSAGRQRPSPCR